MSLSTSRNLSFASTLVLVGTRSFDKSGANDVEIHSRSSFQWLITAVEVRIGAWTF